MRILQMFQWNINSIINVLDEVKKQGFDYIQISPIQPTKEDGHAFWLLYQPCDFSIGNTQIGSREDLKRLCEEAHKRELKIISDIVLRHIAGKNTGEMVPHEKVADYIKRLKYLPKQNINYGNRNSEIHDSAGLPSLNYNDPLVLVIYNDFITDLFVTGVDGLRVDMGKHFALPHEGSQFWPWLSGKCRDWGKVLYAEAIQSSKELLDYYCQYTMVGTDSFATNRDKMVTWVESHDDYLSWGGTKNMNDWTIINEYRILCREYKNTLFYTRPFSELWRNEEIRKINLGY